MISSYHWEEMLTMMRAVVEGSFLGQKERQVQRPGIGRGCGVYKEKGPCGRSPRVREGGNRAGQTWQGPTGPSTPRQEEAFQGLEGVFHLG